MSRRSVQEAVSQLETAGMLSVDRLPGRKPTWTLFVLAGDPGTVCQGLPVENWDRPQQELPDTLAQFAGEGGTSCHPAPPIENIENIENRNIGDDELRKISDEETEAFRTRVHRFGDLLGQLLSKEPDSETVEVLEGLTIDARDLPAWDALIELAERAVLLSPNLQAADA